MIKNGLRSMSMHYVEEEGKSLSTDSKQPEKVLIRKFRLENQTRDYTRYSNS